MTPEVLFLMKAERAAENLRQAQPPVDDKVRFQNLFWSFLDLFEKPGNKSQKGTSSKASTSFPCPEGQGC